MSLPSEETDLYFSVTLTTPVQRVASLRDKPHERLPPAVTVGMPVLSDTAMVTCVPAQTGMRWAVDPSEPGSTIFPKMV